MTKFDAFTIKADGILRDIKSNCFVSQPFDINSNGFKNHPKPLEFIGLWDTGATSTVISKRVVDALSLIPSGKIEAYHADGKSWVNTYLVNLVLPNGIVYNVLKVSEGKLEGFDVLIGMDIITSGDFSITNVDGKTTFSFRVPSINRVDFVEEHHTMKTTPFVAAKTPGRNEPCNCGSGKKYKHCHGK